MAPVRKNFWPLAIVVTCVVSLHAELAWESTTIAVEAEPGQKEAKATFRFTNRGNTPVRISDVHANCGCTAAKPAKTEIAPGESGELPATMTVSVGGKSVSIRVKTEEPKAADYTLQFNVTVAELVQMSPRLLYWKVGEGTEEKKMTLKLRAGVQVTAAKVQGADFSVRLGVAENGEMPVWISPKVTSSKAQGILILSAEQSSKAQTEVKAFLRVL